MLILVLLNTLAALLLIALGVCIFNLTKDIREMSAAGLWSRYFKKFKTRKKVLLKSKVQKDLIPTFAPLIVMVIYQYILIFVEKAYIEFIDINVLYYIGVPFVLFLLIYENWVFVQVPTKIRVTSKDILLKNVSLAVNKIPIADIEDIRIATPGKNEIRTLGNTGFCGYYGEWRDKENGEYKALFGKRSQCFLVTTKYGQRYMLSCKKYKEVVELVKSLIQTSPSSL